jgi:uncharacterized protein (TIGR03067 family)
MQRAVPFLVLAAVVLASAAIAAAADAREAAERSRLSGVWLGYTVMGRGENPDQGPVKIQLTINKDAIRGTQFDGGEVIDHGQGSYVLDLNASPPVLDATKVRGRGNLDIWLGVYSLEGDTLKWCVRKKDRPTDFETKDKAFLLILKRQEK